MHEETDETKTGSFAAFSQDKALSRLEVRLMNNLAIIT
jgi:hypothetical protein